MQLPETEFDVAYHIVETKKRAAVIEGDDDRWELDPETAKGLNELNRKLRERSTRRNDSRQSIRPIWRHINLCAH
jgi:hypothetical protein